MLGAVDYAYALPIGAVPRIRPARPCPAGPAFPVMSVNGTLPDRSGNVVVELSIPDELEALADRIRDLKTKSDPTVGDVARALGWQEGSPASTRS